MAQQSLDLFGNPIEIKGDLKKEFGANPFTILDTKDGLWQARKKRWINMGIKSEVGRDAVTYHMKDWANKKGAEGTLKGNNLPSDTSIFDPVLCELMYRWFCPNGGSILDPFAGGSVRGIVANYLGYHYSGIDIRQEQVDSNREQALDILGVENLPQWYVGDSNIVLEQNWQKQFDLVFTCPPYADLEVYSDMKGEYYGFVADTVKLMQRCSGMTFYNDAILATSLASAALRAGGNMKSGKLVKVHQNVLMFKKV